MDDDGASETYPEIDSVSASVLKAAGVKMTMLPSLTKEDLRDLFPGPENFLRRRHIWQLVHGDVESQKSNCPVLDTSVSSPASSVASSSASTVILEKSTPSTSQEDLLSGRRAFIDSDVMKEQDRPTKILQAYPCFKELSHIIDELHRILARGNPFFTMELKKRWLRFFNQAQFYGVFKKFIGPPLQDQVKNALAVLKVLPQMFPSHVGLPKRLGHPSDALFHILTSAEDPNTYLQSRPLVSPVVIVCETNCILAIGTVPLLTFPKEDLSESVMYLLGCYYTFHLTYPKCIGTLLSVLQTDVLLDAIHEKDMTTSYKKAMAEWRKFHE
uniref:Uncharacterized protein n=1 Tax=Knipowitschia caucasica TaxID=637954 RepID=A0AAV2J4Y4_KNICA